MFQALLLSFFISAAVALLVIKLSPKLGLLDNPKKRQHPATLHITPLSRGGGIPIFAALVVSSLIFMDYSPMVVGLILGSALILLIGIMDDRRDLSPVLRLFINTVTGLILVLSGVVISFLTNPFGGIIEF